MLSKRVSYFNVSFLSNYFFYDIVKLENRSKFHTFTTFSSVYRTRVLEQFSSFFENFQVYLKTNV